MGLGRIFSAGKLISIYRGKPEGAKIIGIRTDFRNAGESAGAVVNATIECARDKIARSSEELLETISRLLI